MIRENHGATNRQDNIIKSGSLLNYFDLGRNLSDFLYYTCLKIGSFSWLCQGRLLDKSIRLKVQRYAKTTDTVLFSKAV